jgi:lipoate-protein ligase A
MSSSEPRLIGRSASEQFAREQNALRRGEAFAAVSALEGESLVSVGMGVRDTTPSSVAARGSGLTVVRRSTGGTALLHVAGDLLWSIVLPRDDPRVGRDYVHGYARLGAPVVRWLASLGVASAWEPAPALSTEYCTLGERGQVLMVGHRILGGAAQHATRTALLHHGTVVGTVDRGLTSRIFRATAPDTFDRLAGLRDLGVTASADDLAEGLLGALEAFVAESPPSG